VRGRQLAVGLLALAAVIAGCTVSSTRSNGAIPIASTTVVPVTTTIAARRGGTLGYAAGPPMAGFNVNTKVAHTTTDLAVMDQVWPSVFHLAPDGTPELDTHLMTSAAVTGTDPETVMLKINPAASWSDGVPITADDFVYFWRQQRDPLHTLDHCNDPECTTNGKPIDDYSDGGGYNDIKSVTGSDGGKTVTIVFSRTYGDWQSLWSHIVPAHLAQKVGWNSGFDKGDPMVVVSGGPYKIYSYEKGVALTLVPNDRYWATPPTLDSIVFRFVADPAQQVADLQTTTVDMVNQLAPEPALVDTVKATAGVRTELGSSDRLNQLWFNTSTPGLGDVAVRKAIATAIDRPSLVRAALGQSSGAVRLDNNRIILDDQAGYRDSSGGLYDRGDAARARQMLEADGYRAGPDGVYVKGSSRLAFRLTSAMTGTLGAQALALLRQQLGEAGIQTTVQVTPAPVALGPATTSQSFDLAVVSETISAFPSDNIPLYAQLGPPASVTAGGVVRPELAEDLTFGAGAVDPATEKLFFNQADAVMWQNMWTLPLFRTPTMLAVRNSFLNVHANPNAEGPFWNAQTWNLRSSAGER
jgi:peptide/nickel transport system substrate-binding protein